MPRGGGGTFPFKCAGTACQDTAKAETKITRVPTTPTAARTRGRASPAAVRPRDLYCAPGQGAPCHQVPAPTQGSSQTSRGKNDNTHVDKNTRRGALRRVVTPFSGQAARGQRPVCERRSGLAPGGPAPPLQVKATGRQRASPSTGPRPLPPLAEPALLPSTAAPRSRGLRCSNINDRPAVMGGRDDQGRHRAPFARCLLLVEPVLAGHTGHAWPTRGPEPGRVGAARREAGTGTARPLVETRTVEKESQ